MVSELKTFLGHLFSVLIKSKPVDVIYCAYSLVLEYYNVCNVQRVCLLIERVYLFVLHDVMYYYDSSSPLL